MKSIDRDGYVLVHMPNHPKVRKNNYVPEHRLVFEQYYNCCLLSWVDIHHKDGNKLNNDISNLEPLMHKKHAELPRKDMSKRFCFTCGSNTTRLEKPNNIPHWYKKKEGYLCYNCNQTKKFR